MSQAIPQSPITLEEFYKWNQSNDTRYELISGMPLAMAPPQRAHRVVAGNLAVSIGSKLRERRDCTLEPEAGILSPTQSNTYYQADLAVTCQPHRAGQQEIPEPLLIIEVLSPSTENHDRKVKVPDYREIPSVQEILLVDPSRYYCEIHHRIEKSRWIVDLIRLPSATLHIDALGMDIPLSEIYASVEMEDASSRR